jgi:uncharacterized protein YggE
LVGGAGLGLGLTDSRGSSTTTVHSCGGNTPRLTVQGTGQASGTPNLLTAVLSINVTAGSATAALSEDNTKVNAVVLGLLAGGATKKDVQTSDLTMQLNYAYPKGVPTVTGYQVDNTVTASLHDITRAGTAIDNVVGAAGNAVQINSLSFSFNNPSAVQDQARASAVHQAVSHAHAMALAAGRRLGQVCSLTDNTQSIVAPDELQNFGTAGAAANATAAPVPVEAGSQSETDQVTVVYALDPH